MAAAQPISFTTSNHATDDAGASVDYPMDLGSYNGSGNGSFNPASYTRHFLGSPVSWRAGSISFGGRVFPSGSPMHQFLGSLEAREFKLKPSSSLESDKAALRNDLQIFDREGELCRDYWCCGVHLLDFHALIEHFEEVHVQVVEHPSGSGQTTQIQIPFNPQPAQSTSSSVAPTATTATAAAHIQNSYHAPFDVDDMEIDTEEAPSMSSRSSPSSMSEVTTPPDTPVTTPGAAYSIKGYAPNTADSSPFGSQPPSPGRDGQSQSRPLNLNISSAFSRASTPQASQAKIEPFNAYARHMQGDNSGAMDLSYPETEDEDCVPPAMLHSSNGPARKASSPPPPQAQAPVTPVLDSEPATPVSAGPPTPTMSNPMQGMSAAARLSASMTRPAASLLLSKPHKCPKPNCTKSYKQANGLKYHMTHGSCNFAPSKDLEHVQALLERKRRDRAAAAIAEGADPSLMSPIDSPLGSAFPDFGQISESELREVEVEAEKRLRPFACGVGDCTRRYKNMNGLRYHYQHSGEHGAIGLTMLASGTHECLNHSSRDNALRGERENRKAKAKANQAEQLSRSNSMGQARPYTTYSNNDPAPPASAFASATQAQAQLAYQQRFAEQHRAHMAQQPHPQHQQQSEQPPAPSLQQQPQPPQGPPKLTFGQTYSIKTEAA